MSVHVLRRAAAQIRIEYNDPDLGWPDPFYRALSEWLDAEADAHSDDDESAGFWADVDSAVISECCRMPQAIAVALAFLDESP